MGAGGEIGNVGQALGLKRADRGRNADLPLVVGDVLLGGADHQGDVLQARVFQREFLVAFSDAAGEGAVVLVAGRPVHVHVEGRHATHGQAAEGPVLDVGGDVEQFFDQRDDGIFAVLGDAVELPLAEADGVDRVVHAHQDRRFGLALGDQVVHDVADAALMRPVGLVAAASVGDQDQRIGLCLVIAGRQVDRDGLGLAVDILVGQIGQRAFGCGILGRQPEAFLLWAHVEHAVVLRASHGRHIRWVGRIRDHKVIVALHAAEGDLFKILQPDMVALAVGDEETVLARVAGDGLLAEFRIQDEAVGVGASRQLVGDLVDAIGVQVHLVYKEAANGVHPVLILGGRILGVVLDHAGLVRVTGQVALVEEKLAAQEHAVHLLRH